MANKQSSEQSLRSALERKFRQTIASIAGRARTAINTQSGIEFVSAGGTETVVSKSFRSGFFKSPGDTIALFVQGSIYIPAGKTGSFQIRITETGTIDPTEYPIRIPLTAGDITVPFTGLSRLVLLTEDRIQVNGVTLAGDITPSVRNRRAPGPYTFNSQSFGISGISISDAGVEVNLDLFQIEFIPAVIE